MFPLPTHTFLSFLPPLLWSQGFFCGPYCIPPYPGRTSLPAFPPLLWTACHYPCPPPGTGFCLPCTHIPSPCPGGRDLYNHTFTTDYAPHHHTVWTTCPLGHAPVPPHLCHFACCLLPSLPRLPITSALGPTTITTTWYTCHLPILFLQPAPSSIVPPT